MRQVRKVPYGPEGHVLGGDALIYTDRSRRNIRRMGGITSISRLQAAPWGNT
jgi:hypothetical protein